MCLEFERMNRAMGKGLEQNERSPGLEQNERRAGRGCCCRLSCQGQGGESPSAPSWPLIIVEARMEKTVKPQVGLGSWQGSGQEEGAGQVSLPNLCSFCNFLHSGSQLLLPCPPARPSLWRWSCFSSSLGASGFRLRR